MAVERGGGRPRELTQEQVKSRVEIALKQGFLRSCLLKGPVLEENITHFIVCLRQTSKSGNVRYSTVIDEDKGFTRNDLDLLINGLKAPRRSRCQSVFEDDKKAFDYARKALFMENTPFAVLIMGETENTEQEKIVIFMADGLSIETVVKAFKSMNDNSKEGRKPK